MRRVEHLTALSFVTVLLFTELDDTGEKFYITKTRWCGELAYVLYQIAWYCLLYSVVSSLITSYYSYETHTPARVAIPTLFFFLGVSSYLCEIAVLDYVKWHNVLLSEVEENGVMIPLSYGHIPEDTLAQHYAGALVPFIVFLLGIVYTAIDVRNYHTVLASEYKKYGIRYDDAESSIDEKLRQARLKQSFKSYQESHTTSGTSCQRFGLRQPSFLHIHPTES